MADIILAGDSFSLKKLRNAAEQLEDAQNLMQKVYDAVFSTSFWAEANPFALLDGSKNMNVFDGTIDELHTYQQRVHQKEEAMRTLAQRIEAVVRELAETDQSFRGKLSGESEKNTWERITGAGRNVRQIVSAAALSLIGAINGLFSLDGTVAGETVIETPVQKKSDLRTMKSKLFTGNLTGVEYPLQTKKKRRLCSEHLINGNCICFLRSSIMRNWMQ